MNEKINFSKIKKILIFLTVFFLPLEISIFQIFGKEVKVWSMMSLVLGLILVFEIFKKDFSILKNLKSFFIACALVFFSLLAFLNSPLPFFAFSQFLVLVLLLIFLVFFEKYSEKFKKSITEGVVLGVFLTSILAIAQNAAFNLGLPNFEFMDARPNVFFPEPDWLGFYLALSLLFIFYKKEKKELPKAIKGELCFTLFFLLSFIALIITVARASWLAFASGMFVFIFIVSFSEYLKNKNWRSFFKDFFKRSGYLLSVFVFSVLLIQIFNLTRFNLKDRVRSIFFGEHIVTVAVDQKTKESFKIDLEEKQKYLAQGYLIQEKYVEDENVLSRGEKAESALDVIKKHPLLGSGLGIMLIVTNYEHNANNLFLEWWASSGIGAFLLLIALVLFLIFRGLSFLKTDSAKAAFLLSGVVGFVFLNLFNASIFLAFAWFFLGLLLSEVRTKSKN